LRPQRCQVDRCGRVAHLTVKVRQHSCACRLVADREGALDVPVLANGSAGIQNAAQSILESLAIVRLLANSNISHESEHRTAPVGASPGMCVVESLIAR